MSHLGLRLTPHGHLVLEQADDAPGLDPRSAARLDGAFARGTGPGLLQLGAGEVGQALPPALAWWRGFAARYVAALSLHAPDADADAPSRPVLPAVAAPDAADLAALSLTAPMTPGSEYLTPEVLLALWAEMEAAANTALAAAGADLQGFLKALNLAWNLVGRVHFNLAENRQDADFPFAFMATYTTQLSAQAKARHVPLGQALRDYAGAANRSKLLALLMPVQRAAEACAWLRPMVEAGEIFHPLRWAVQDAARFLSSVPDLEAAGVIVRMPASWPASRPARIHAARRPSAGHRRARAPGLAECIRIHEARPGRSHHRPMETGGRRRVARAYGRVTGDRGGGRCSCAQPHAGAWMPELRLRRLTSGWAGVSAPAPLIRALCWRTPDEAYEAGRMERLAA